MQKSNNNQKIIASVIVLLFSMTIYHNIHFDNIFSYYEHNGEKSYDLENDGWSVALESQYDMKPAFVADVLTSMLVEIRRKYKLDTSSLTEENFRDLFKYLSEDKIHKDIVLDVLIDMIRGKFDITKYEGLSTEEIHTIVKEVVESNKGAPFGALMGMCMKKLAGKASGQVISKAIKELI